MRLMRNSSIVLFFAVVAIVFAPAATAFGCVPCADECCVTAPVSHQASIGAKGSLVAILPAETNVGQVLTTGRVACLAPQETPSPRTAEAPLRI